MKRVPTIAMIAIVLWVTTILSPVIQAQVTAQTDIRQSGQTLTNQGLFDMLSGLGYEPTKLTSGYLVSIKKDSWTYNMQLVISPDTTKIGINANLGKVKATDDVTAKQWMKLLADNRDIDPSSFYFDQDQKKVYLHRVLDNRSITPAYVRQQVDNFCANIQTTSADWSFLE